MLIAAMALVGTLAVAAMALVGTLAVAAMALVGTLAVAAGPALASNCPVVIKQGRDVAATMNASDPKVKQALAKLDEAQKLHDTGKHSESLNSANEALDLLGVKK